ncbi:ABC-2 type transport system permease protein [Zhouia amylolytica]|uniref:ABC transporter permease n=2 Tax=Zhouia amylolytica TaxID=376730 RepID=W2UP08_9FLAO|nr:ABC transporter permease [Zhouia amylolytica]ETN95206.1 ABC transporter permease [Zhouia amylolytica AD3]MCQ0111920.1 ABC transporter permease [Zhouia amylolytica]SFS67685.1 ABC-2 type transport system permease protein [Zhouia amylolytica]
MNHLLLVIKREYINKVRNKSFIVMTFLSPLIFVGLAALVAYLSQINSDSTKTIAVLDESGYFEELFLSDGNLSYHVLENTTLADAQNLVKGGNTSGLLYIPSVSLKDLSNSIEFFSEESPSFNMIEGLTDKIEKKIFNLNLQYNNVDATKIEDSRVDVDIVLENFSGEKTSKLGNVLKLVFGGVAGYLLMMFIIIYGNMIMRSVIEEKTNRIIEIIISSVKPIQLMMGKIIGTSLAGITQFLMWLIVGGVLLGLVSVIFNVDLVEARMQQPQMLLENAAQQENIDVIAQSLISELFHLPLGTLIASFVVYFIGGYLLYSSLYAAIGAAVDNETDTQQFMLPIIMPLMLGIYVGFFTVMEDPHGTVSTIFSFIPFTSPIVMLMRIPFGVPIWQIILSILTLYLTFSLTVWFAAKIYRVGILMYGKKASYKEIFKWIKYS